MKFYLAAVIFGLSLFQQGYCGLRILYSFDAYLHGQNLSAATTFDNGATFYGQTASLMYKIDPLLQQLTVLNTPTDRPRGDLTITANKQVIYGISGETVFKMNIDGQDKRIIHKFSYDTYDEGYSPIGKLVLSHDEQTLYGLTESGGLVVGRVRGGVVYKINLKDDAAVPRYEVLYAFSGKEDGSEPLQVLLSPDEQYLYGFTAKAVGNAACSNLFRIKLKKPVEFQVLQAFNCSQYTLKNMIISKDGNTLYAISGKGYGSIIKIDLSKPNYPITLLREFIRDNRGQDPTAIVLSSDEKILYGVASGWNSKNFSAWPLLFSLQLKPKLRYRVLETFNSWEQPQWPTGILINAENTKLYGISQFGGDHNWGSLYEFSLN